MSAFLDIDDKYMYVHVITMLILTAWQASMTPRGSIGSHRAVILEGVAEELALTLG